MSLSMSSADLSFCFSTKALTVLFFCYDLRLQSSLTNGEDILNIKVQKRAVHGFSHFYLKALRSHLVGERFLFSKNRCIQIACCTNRFAIVKGIITLRKYVRDINMIFLFLRTRITLKHL